MEYSNIITLLCPDSLFTITDNIYSTLVWNVLNTYTKPSENEIVSKGISLTSDLAYNELRYERDKLLLETDKYTLSDYPHASTTIKNDWLSYRTSLRDITLQEATINIYTGEISNINWPTKP